MMKKTLSLLLVLLTVLSAVPAFAVDSDNMNKDGYSTSYSYGYDYWAAVQESPDPYRVKTVIDSLTLGLETKLNKPQSLYVRGNDLYIVDTFNNRILQVEYKNNTYQLKRIIDRMNGGSPETFKTPYDVFVDPEGNIYVADYGNYRVAMMDRDLNWVKDYVKPDDSTFDQKLDFLPKKITVDVAGRVYAIVTNVNKGLVKYEADGTFTGYIGATKVNISAAEYIWKRYFQSKAQREASTAFVPTEYENLYIDKDNFIYTTITSFDEYALEANQVTPIRRLNGLGSDILVRNDNYYPIGDLWWIEADSTYYGPSRLTDVTVFDNDIYLVLDRIRGRVFGYDDQGVLLWAFGTRGGVDGAFIRAVSLEHMGYDLMVLDEAKNSVTVFTPTEYGQMIYSATELYQQGEYNRSAEEWTNVMKLNANYPLAFRGLGRALMRENRFEEAMKYFKMAYDDKNYGRAFKLYRKEWVEKNVWWILLGLAVVIIIPLTIGRIKRTKWEVIAHEQSKVRKNNG